MTTFRIKLTFGGYWVSLLASYWESLMACNYKAWQGWDYSSLLQCSISKRLQQWQKDLKSNNMAASEDGRGMAVAEALGGKRLLLGGGRKRLQQGCGGSTLGGSRKRLQRGRSKSWL